MKSTIADQAEEESRKKTGWIQLSLFSNENNNQIDQETDMRANTGSRRDLEKEGAEAAYQTRREERTVDTRRRHIQRAGERAKWRVTATRLMHTDDSVMFIAKQNRCKLLCVFE